jgi:hypothetical protein
VDHGLLGCDADNFGVKISNLTSIIRVVESRRITWAGHVELMGYMRNAYKILVGSPEWKQPLGRPRHKWENNIKGDLKKQGGRLWIGFIRLTIGTSGGLL